MAVQAIYIAITAADVDNLPVEFFTGMLMPLDDTLDLQTRDVDARLSVPEIARHCNLFKGADHLRSVGQISLTLALFAATIFAILKIAGFMPWLAAFLVLPAAGLLIRIFIIQHDCGHGSYFNNKAANDWTGRFLGVLTVTPYDFWRRAHNMHHATSGDLDRRSIGGIDTITVAEYRALSPASRRAYRVYRHPLFLLLLGTPFYVLILQRIPFKQVTGFHEGYKSLPASSIWRSVIGTNIAVALFFAAGGALFGFWLFALVYVSVLVVTAWIGGWLFYIQHQFEHAYWERHENWDTQEAALLGSSYYVLPPVLQWFTGNIGLHHIHHLCSQIPNYKLQDCMDARPELGAINRLTLRDSLECLRHKLWDEDARKMVGFGAVYSF